MNWLTISILCLAASMWLNAAPQSADKAEVAYKAALEKEVADGDLKSAIAQYERLARGSNRAVAANALVRMGQCYEKLGSAEARKAYERAIREFAEQKDAASQARARLAALGGAAVPAAGPHMRVVWDDAVDTWGTATSDGRYISLPDWVTSDVSIRDMATGEIRRLTNRGGFEKSGGETEGTAISLDGTKVAFTWLKFTKPKTTSEYELHVINSNGQGERILLQGKQFSNLQPHAWSPDGARIAVSAREGTRYKLLLVPHNGGAVQTAWEVPESAQINISPGARMEFSPDGRWLAVSVRSEGPQVTASVFVLPVAGQAGNPVEVAKQANLAAWARDGKSLYITHWQNNTATLHELPMRDGKAGGPERMLAALPPNPDGVIGLSSGGVLYVRAMWLAGEVLGGPFDASLATVGPLNKVMAGGNGGPRDLVGMGVRYSPDGKKILAMADWTTARIRTVATGDERSLLIQLPRLSRVEWNANGSALLAGGMSNGGERGIFEVHLQTGAARMLVAVEQPWLFAMSPDGGGLYYFKRSSLFIRDLASGSERQIPMNGLGDGTLPWQLQLSPDGQRLACYQQGTLWITDVSTGQTAIKYSREDGEFRGISWTPDNRFVVALESNWRKKLKEQVVLYPVDGGDPIRKDAPTNKLQGLWLSPDGRQMLTVRRESKLQVWALENFLAPGK
ncbi:MAG: hypothetical protein J0L64_07940 [Acidobacteria bacterium]|nr:hypothetical protein [Acidobacteriota bacterium]